MSEDQPCIWRIGGAEFDETSCTVTASGRTHRLDHSSLQVLGYLVRRPGLVALKDDLLSIGWPGRVVSESSLTKTIRRIRLALGDDEGTVLLTVHGYGFRLSIIPERAESQPDPPEAALPSLASSNGLVRSRSYRTLVLVGGLVVVLALTLGFWGRGSSRGTSPKPEMRSAPALAVMPFEDMSPGRDQSYLALGISEEVLSRVARTPDLRVVSRASSRYFQDKKASADQIGKALGVTHLLEGSVRTRANSVRVTVHLVRARDGRAVWSQSYERHLGDALALEDEIASAVAQQLNRRLSEPKLFQGPVNPRAYSLFMKARQTFSLAVKGDNRPLEIAKEVVRIAPDYSDGWWLLGTIYVNQITMDMQSEQEGLRLARPALERARALNPRNPKVYMTLGYISLIFEEDYKRAAAFLEKGSALDPTDESVIYAAGMLLNRLGRTEDSLATLQHVVDRDPLFVYGYVYLGERYLRARRWDDAIRTLTAAQSLNSAITEGPYLLARALTHKGDLQGALSEFNKLDNRYQKLTGVSICQHLLGRAAESDSALKDLLEMRSTVPANDMDDYIGSVASAYAMRNERDEAFKWLGRLDTSHPTWSSLYEDADFDQLHSDARWIPLLRKFQIAPEQLAAKRAGVTFEFDPPPVAPTESRSQ